MDTKQEEENDAVYSVEVKQLDLSFKDLITLEGGRKKFVVFKIKYSLNKTFLYIIFFFNRYISCINYLFKATYKGC